MRVNINKPLIIYGNPGTGKTTLAKKLLNDTILTIIDFYNTREQKNIKHYIVNSLKRKNITLMMNINKNRGLLIDDIHIIYKNDLKNYHNIISFLKEKNFYNSKIIITCSEGFLSNKYMKSLKYEKYKINIKDNYLDICDNIIENRKITIPKEKKERLIKKSNYNLNILISFIDNSDIDEKDEYYSDDIISEKIINKDIKYSEIVRVSNDSKIILNLLDNVYNYISNKKDLLNIYDSYNNYLLADNYSKEYNRDIIPIYTTCVINYYSNIKNYNRYKSVNYYFNRSSLSINNKIILDSFNVKFRMILLYMIKINYKYDFKDINDIIEEIKVKYPKGLSIYYKLYEFLY